MVGNVSIGYVVVEVMCFHVDLFESVGVYSVVGDVYCAFVVNILWGRGSCDCMIVCDLLAWSCCIMCRIQIKFCSL